MMYVVQPRWSNPRKKKAFVQQQLWRLQSTQNYPCSIEQTLSSLQNLTILSCFSCLEQPLSFVYILGNLRWNPSLIAEFTVHPDPLFIRITVHPDPNRITVHPDPNPTQACLEQKIQVLPPSPSHHFPSFIGLQLIKGQVKRAKIFLACGNKI